MAKQFKKIGIRRENNFSDLSSPKDSLNNLLGKLVSGTTVTFISEDLDAIRGIYSSDISNSEYRKIAGSRVRTTNSRGQLVNYYPNITYQNRFDSLKVFGGEPRLFGGNGLTAKYYDEDQINPYSFNIFSGQPFLTDNFWEVGNFYFNPKISQLSPSVDGGIEWEGYFIPTSTESYEFRISSSGYYTFDFQTQGYTSGIGTYTEITRIGIASTVPGSGTLGGNSITIGSTNTKYVAIGQTVSGTGIHTGSIVENFNRSTGSISLTPPLGISSAVYSTFTNNDVTFIKNAAETSYIEYRTYPLVAFNRYRIKFRYYTLQNSPVVPRRYINISARPFADYLRYNYLYSLDYDFSEGAKGTINKFMDNSLNLGGGTVGSLTNSSEYVSVKTSNVVDIRYQPKTSVSSIVSAAVTVTSTTNLNVITLNDTTGIEVGNYIFGGGIPSETRVSDIYPNEFIFMDKNATLGIAATTFTFIDHRGFVKRAIGSGSGGTFTLSSGDTTNLRNGMIMIGAGVTIYTGITTTGSLSSFQISPPQTIGSGTTVYFYESKGLINNGLVAFCGNDIVSCLTASQSVNSGSTTIFVDNLPGSIGGWSVQGLYFNSGTTITGSTATSITISSPTTANIPQGAVFTIADPNSGSRLLCCPPTDTSPPFNATLTGLETPSDASSIRIESGNLVFNSFTASIGIGSITTATITDTSNMRLSIQTPATNTTSAGTATTTIFKILCSSQ